MTKKRNHNKTYTKEFKLDAIRLMEASGRPPAEIAMQLGLQRNQLLIFIFTPIPEKVRRQ